MDSSNEPSRKSGGHLRELDLGGIQYPSDALSIGALRRKHPALFDKGFAEPQPLFFMEPQDAGHAGDVLGGMLYCERLVALFAYAEAIGTESASELHPGFDFKDELIELYTRHGIATGRHHAAQLIRGIEQQAQQLANQRNP